MLPNPNFWRGKRVLLTGHTGFKGAWLALWLHRMGAEVTGIALPPDSRPALSLLMGNAHLQADHSADIRDAAGLSALVQRTGPDVVFHLAARALVRASYQDPLDAFSSNVMGTANLLEAVRSCDSVRVVVAVTTDKVYQNREWLYPYREDDALGGHDPYSASKAACELVIASYRASFLAARGVAVASVRAGNVIGGGDWSADRLIPDAVRAWSQGQPLQVRYPQAVRPWQHVLDPLAGYLQLAQAMWQTPALAGAFNFGPEPGGAKPVRDVIELARQSYGSGEVCFGTTQPLLHESKVLTLETAKARHVLGFVPRWPLVEAVQRSMVWYRAHSGGADARDLCLRDIAAYEVEGVKCEGVR